MPNKKVRPWMGLLGFLGFIGIAGFVLNTPIYLLYFSFFGLFGLYWEGKLNLEKADERLKYNYSNAQKFGYRFGMAMILAVLLLSTSVLKDTKHAMMIQTAMISLSVAITLIIVPLLAYYLDKGEYDRVE